VHTHKGSLKVKHDFEESSGAQAAEAMQSDSKL
jgi:hypothetical protein